jgi:hypothetical protein
MKPISYIKYLLKNYTVHLAVNFGILVYLIIYTSNGGAGGIVGTSIVSISTLVIFVGSKMAYIKYVDTILNTNQKDKIKWTKQ